MGLDGYGTLYSYNIFHFTLGYRCRMIYIITFVLVPVLCDLCVHRLPPAPLIRTTIRIDLTMFYYIKAVSVNLNVDQGYILEVEWLSNGMRVKNVRGACTSEVTFVCVYC